MSYWRRECAVRPEREFSASAWRSRLVREVLSEDGENIAVRRKGEGASAFFTHPYWDLETTMTTFKNNIILRAQLEHSGLW